MTEHAPVKIEGPNGVVHLCRSVDSVTMCGHGYPHVDTDAAVNCQTCWIEGRRRADALFDVLHPWRFTPDGMPVADLIWVAWHPESGEAESGRPVEQISSTAARKYWQSADFPTGIVAWRLVIRHPTPAPPP